MLNKEEIIDYFKLVNSHAKKELGQNFLINKNIVQDIVDKLEISPDDEVLKIGPGLGALTSTILTKNYKRFKVVEYDQKFVELLAKSYEDKKIEIAKNNILKERDYSFINCSCGNIGMCVAKTNKHSCFIGNFSSIYDMAYYRYY